MNGLQITLEGVSGRRDSAVLLALCAFNGKGISIWLFQRKALMCPRYFLFDQLLLVFDAEVSPSVFSRPGSRPISSFHTRAFS